MPIYTPRLRQLAVFGLVLNILHGIEVSQTHFYVTSPDFYPYTQYFQTIPEAVYYVQHGSLYMLLFFIICFILGGVTKFKHFESILGKGLSFWL